MPRSIRPRYFRLSSVLELDFLVKATVYKHITRSSPAKTRSTDIRFASTCIPPRGTVNGRGPAGVQVRHSCDYKTFALSAPSTTDMFVPSLLVAALATATAVSSVSWTATPFLPPSYPLAVRTPYLSAWLPQGSGAALNDVWPQFWNGQANHFIAIYIPSEAKLTISLCRLSDGLGS